MSIAGWLKGIVPIGTLCAALFLVQCSRIDGLQADVARKDAELAARERDINELRKEPPWLNAVMEGFSHETMDISAFRKAMRQELGDAMRDPDFAAWAGGGLPARVRPSGGLLGGKRAGGRPAGAAVDADTGTARP